MRWQAGLTGSNTTKHHKVTCIKQFFAWAVDMEFLDRDPAVKLAVPKRPKTLPKFLSEAEVRYLINDWTPAYRKRDAFLVARDRTLLKLLTLTGLRRTEVSALNVGDVSLAHRVLIVRAGKGNRDRTVGFPPAMVTDLLVLTSGRAPDAPLFMGKGIRGVPQRLSPRGYRWCRAGVRGVGRSGVDMLSAARADEPRAAVGARTSRRRETRAQADAKPFCNGVEPVAPGRRARARARCARRRPRT